MARYKALLVAALLSVSMTSIAGAQANAVKILDAVDIFFTPPVPVFVFASTDVQLRCEAGDTTVLSSTADGTGDLIADNYVAVNASPWIPGFSSFLSSCLPHASTIGFPASACYIGVTAPDISSLVGTGMNRIELLDAGVVGASSEVWLVTDCRIMKISVCHKPGTPAEKVLQLPPSAIAGHLGHGDTLGACL